MLPAQRVQVLQQRGIDGVTVATQGVRGPLQIDCIPQYDGCRHQVKAAGPVALLLETAVAGFTQSVEEHSTGQCVACLALVQSSMHAATQIHTLQPVQDKQRALNAAQLT